MPLRFADIVLDCHDPQKLSEFWSAAIGYKVLWVIDQYVALEDPSKLGPTILLQGVAEPRTGKNPNSSSLTTSACCSSTLPACQSKCLGATRVAELQGFNHHWVVLQDPEGNEFCVRVELIPAAGPG